MDREEILKRSRAEKEDEGVTYAENKGRRVGVIAFCLVFVIIAVFDFLMEQNSYAPFAMFWAYIAAEGWGKYRASGSRTHLWVVVCGGVSAVGWLACYILTVVKAAL